VRGGDTSGSADETRTELNGGEIDGNLAGREVLYVHRPLRARRACWEEGERVSAGGAWASRSRGHERRWGRRLSMQSVPALRGVGDRKPEGERGPRGFAGAPILSMGMLFMPLDLRG